MPATDWRGLGGHCPTLVRLGGARVWPGPRGPGHPQWMSWSGARLEGRGTAAHRDLARLRLLGHRDGERQNAVGVTGDDVGQVEAVPEGELAGEGASGALVGDPSHALRGVRLALRADRHGAVLDVDVDRRGVDAVSYTH